MNNKDNIVGKFVPNHKIKINSSMSLCPPVVVVLSTGVSYEDINGNIGMWLHADSSHTLKWFILFVGKQEIFLRSKYL